MVLSPLLVYLFPRTCILALTPDVRIQLIEISVPGWSAMPALTELIALLLGAVVGGLLVGGSWLLFQILCQQGRLLLRLEGLEARLSSDNSVSQDAPTDGRTGSSSLANLPIVAPATPLVASHVSNTQSASQHRKPVTITEEEGDIELTIGMATYHDFDGVYFTLQALRLYQDLDNTELLVIDNYGCEYTRQLVEEWLHGRYIRATEVVGTAAPRELVFRHARGKAVLCCDSHVLFAPGAIARLKQFYREHPDCQDLLQGPLLYDDGRRVSTHFAPVWREQMWGIWATDSRGEDAEGEPFEIPMQGLGVFSCRKAVWPGFHPQFRGFGGEEGYIHEKVRQVGGRCLCLPWLRWMHRFGRPAGVKYPLTVEDKLRNYVLGHADLGLDLAPVLAHFAQSLSQERVQAVSEQALADLGTGPSSQGKAQVVTQTNAELAGRI